METQSRLTKESYPLIERTIPDGKKFEIPGYSLEEVIYESNRTRLWRGKRQSDGLLLLIKESVSSEQSAQELAELLHEHEITQDLEIDGVLRAEELVQCENGSVLILENTEGLPLRKLMDAARLDLLDSLKVAVSLTSILNEVHRQGLLHKIINPFNIFVDPASGNIKLSGFGLATRLPRENSTTLSPQLSGETLPYISPEQTGRMNRVLDYRSDFYSLGVTLYELFSRRVPFEYREAMEIIHAHIARQPVPPDQMAPRVPKPLSNMVMKLMAKRAEVRYQSHSGLSADLLACEEQLENQGSLSDFPLGRYDMPEELQIAPGLYGRKNEITDLEGALERVSQGATEMVLISGTAGVGKTTLVGEIHRSIAQKNGFFIAATNQDLKQQMKKGLMRKDFFYRIHIIPIHLPPLRERKEDIPLLIEHFMQNHPPSKNLPPITLRVMEALTSYDWPGNVRELINTLHRYLTLKKLDFLDTSLIDASQTEPPVSIEERETNEPLDATMKRLEKLYLTRVLEDNDWQQSKVSALLGVDPKTLYRKIKQYYLKPS